MVRSGEFVQLRLKGSMTPIRGYVYSKSRGYDMAIELFDGSIVSTNSAEDIEKGSIIELAWNERGLYGDGMGVLTEEERFDFLFGSVLQGKTYERNHVGYHRQPSLFEVGDFYRRSSGDPEHEKGKGIGWDRLYGSPGGQPNGYVLYPRIWHTPNDSLNDRLRRVEVTRDSERREGAEGYKEEDYDFVDTYTVTVTERDSNGNWRGGYREGAFARGGLTLDDAMSHALQVADTISGFGGDIAQVGYDYGKDAAKKSIEQTLRDARQALKQVFGDLKLEEV